MNDLIAILPLLAIGLVGLVLYRDLSRQMRKLTDLEERLTRLERDAVKVVFRDPFSPQDEVSSSTRKSNPKQMDGVKSEEPFVKTRKKRKPKTVKEWEDEIDLGGHE